MIAALKGALSSLKVQIPTVPYSECSCTKQQLRESQADPQADSAPTGSGE